MKSRKPSKFEMSFWGLPFLLIRGILECMIEGFGSGSYAGQSGRKPKVRPVQQAISEASKLSGIDKSKLSRHDREMLELLTQVEASGEVEMHVT